ncbi:YbbR-like protein [Neolewinella agarilytica]|uniref:YbbR-like protein n=2 Tax=Neolewinella agarilytica TaxID=478744 RepID=A0A1H8ZGT0_9BACT|nr:CdaR family protein [Neolewinella agarilytica]SEP63551.1 YbbR-like protein [Neolewinella agarilytica]
MLSTLRRLISRNPLKQMADTDRKVLAICMTAAFVFWLILNLSQEYSIRREVTLEYIVDPERVLVGRMPETLEADVSGTGWNLVWESLVPGPLPVTIDIRNRDNLRLTNAELRQQVQRRLSSGALAVDNLGFESVTILTTPKEGKRVPVRSQVSLSFANGFLAADLPILEPDSVTVSGSTDELDDIAYWPTEELTLTGVNNSIKRIVTLAKPAEGLTLSRNEINYTLNVEAFIQKDIEVPVTVVHAPEVDSYRINPSTVSLRVSVPQTAYESINASDFSLVADLENLRNEDGRNSVPVILQEQPDEVISVFFETRSVEYYLIKE